MAGYKLKYIPELLEDHVDFDEYECLINMWSQSSNDFGGLPHSVQGLILLQTLPKHSARFGKNLRPSVCQAVGGLESLKNNKDGVSLILDDLRKRVEKEDKVELQCTVFQDFIQYRRCKDDDIRNFLADFNTKYARCRKFGMTLTDDALYKMIIKAADFDELEQMIVMENFDVEMNKGQLFKKMKERIRVVLSKKLIDENQNYEAKSHE